MNLLQDVYKETGCQRQPKLLNENNFKTNQMNAIQDNTRITPECRTKRYSIITLAFDSMQNKSVKKRFLNFYDPIRPLENGPQTNESKRVP